MGGRLRRRALGGGQPTGGGLVVLAVVDFCQGSKDIFRTLVLCPTPADSAFPLLDHMVTQSCVAKKEAEPMQLSLEPQTPLLKLHWELSTFLKKNFKANSQKYYLKSNSHLKPQDI